MKVNTNSDILLFTPGRLCLFGEHTDWAGAYRQLDQTIVPGHCITVTTNCGIHADAWYNASRLVLDSLGTSLDIPMDLKTLKLVAEEGGFFSYCAGVVYYLASDYHIDGININLTSTLPIRKGLSSSAAICVTIARAFDSIYGLSMSKDDIIRYSCLGEALTRSKCGKMDQIAVCRREPIHLIFDGGIIRVEALKPQRNIYMVVGDLRGEKDTRAILDNLRASFMGRASDVLYALGEANVRITSEAIDAINGGNARRVGQLMDEAQDIFDEYLMPHSPEELTAPRLHEALSNSDIRRLVYGGKGVGSQGDGCAQFVAKGEDEQMWLGELFEDLNIGYYPVTIHGGIG